MSTLIINAKIFSGEALITGKNILIDNGKIVSLTKNITKGVSVIDLKGKNIAPGFIDIQINGGKTRYFSQTPDEQTLDDIYTSCCEYATPFILPTLISSPLEVILTAIDTVRRYRKDHPGVLGMHLEGPFFNPAKRGAHNPNIIRKPTEKELKTILEHGRDVIKVMTIAPEMFTRKQLKLLLDSGIILSAGHSDITYRAAQEIFSSGVQLVTHLYNAMSPLNHRACGLVGAVFDNENVFAPIVLDGGHCDYAAARIAHKIKGDKLFLISDSSFLGRHKRKFDWDILSMKMTRGFYRDADGNLAGAAISMPEAVQNAVRHIGVSPQEAIEMATSRAARAIKMDHQVGFIKKDYPANFVVFDDDLTEFQPLMV